jgi:micrococcal nuclease
MVQLDLGSSQSLKVKVTGIKSFIDGDTTHFYVPTTVSATGILKARYIGVNTPESTGKIEPWGKAASNFTRSKLETAREIWLESDDNKWNIDSTGERHIVWVWYLPQDSDTYRNLNIELIQQGLSLTASGGSTRYGEICFDANIQAQEHELVMYSGEDDPDFWYDDAVPITLISLCTNLELYQGKKVIFEGDITYDINNNVYVQDYDPETDMYYGITVY